MEQSSRSLNGKTELTMIIPVRHGIIDSVGTATYETRLRVLLAGLSGLREAFLDVSVIKPFSDVVERIEFIHSFRLALLPGHPRKLLLAVAFDGAWEPYLRAIWNRLGPLLDVIMCNCEGYPNSTQHSFETYERWIRQYQVPASFFYIHSDAAVGDITYLRDSDRIQRQAGSASEKEDRLKKLKIQNAVERTRAACASRAVDPKLLENLTFVQAVNSLQSLDMLRRYFRSEEDDIVLLRATKEILKELDLKRRPPDLGTELYKFDSSLMEWFDSEVPSKNRPDRQDSPAEECIETANLKNIQGGIIEPYQSQYGAFLMLRWREPDQARQFLNFLKPCLTRADDHHAHNPLMDEVSLAGEVEYLFANLAFTYAGLSRLGVSQSTLDSLPEEFRMGMEARSGLLGDVDFNHPSRWHLPTRNWNAELHGRQFPLNSVDCVLQLRMKTCEGFVAGNDYDAEDAAHPMHALIEYVSEKAKTFNVDLLRVESLVSRKRGHFGFVDGVSQPQIDIAGNNTKVGIETKDEQSDWSDKVSPGEIILGYRNDQDGANASFTPFTKDGTFLVLRKIKQNVEKLNDFLSATANTRKISGDDLKELMMGRRLDGRSMFQPASEKSNNNFNYKNDATGAVCPLQSHVRRANPRDSKFVPRIARRGMSYGPETSVDSNEERGLLFAAYNASIARQFELIQSWLTGGNSSNIESGANDPFLGVSRQLSTKTFSCSFNGYQKHFEVAGPAQEGFTRLQWGTYCFVPSFNTLDELSNATQQEGIDMNEPVPTAPTMNVDKTQLALNQLEFLSKQIVDPATKGKLIIEAFLRHGASDEDWKMMLEDRGAKLAGYSPAIWAAINQHFDGVLHTHTDYGVLVASEQGLHEVLDREQDFSVKVEGQACYHARMKQSVGEIYLGLDDGNEYKDESHYANQAIQSIDQKSAFELAYEVAQMRFNQRKPYRAMNISVVEFVEYCLSKICQSWFDLPDDVFMRTAGKPANVNAKEAHCPMHFTAPSRYIFTPTPSKFSEKSGAEHGQLLQQKALEFVNAKIDAGKMPDGLISRAIIQKYINQGSNLKSLSEDEKSKIASTLVGVMFGFLPTAFGNLLTVLADWVQSKQLWYLQDEFLMKQKYTEFNAYENAQKMLLPELLKSIAKDPTPEMIWRTAANDTQLGDVQIKEGDKVVLSFSGITQNNGDVINTIFGGDRRNTKHPTHSCPGINAALGVMLGTLAAFCTAGEWRAAGSPLLLTLK